MLPRHRRPARKRRGDGREERLEVRRLRGAALASAQEGGDGGKHVDACNSVRKRKRERETESFADVGRGTATYESQSTTPALYGLMVF